MFDFAKIGFPIARLDENQFPRMVGMVSDTINGRICGEHLQETYIYI